MSVATEEPSTSGPQQQEKIQYFAEESFRGADLSRHVHVGWGVVGGAAAILACMVMSAATQSRSWNVSFLWLQRRVGFQFGTLSYAITDNVFHYHDGDKWVHRGFADAFARWGKNGNRGGGGGGGGAGTAQMGRGGASGGGPTFASSSLEANGREFNPHQ